MKDFKKQEGFVVLDSSKIPHDVLSEIRHYNRLLKTSNQSPHQSKALANSEKKIISQLENNRELYPFAIIYGYMPILDLFTKNPFNEEECLLQVNKCRQEFGDNYLNNLLFFEPMDLTSKTEKWGWSAQGSFLEQTPQNVFMLALKTGNVELVKSLLNLVSDPELKKKILLQYMQYWVGNELCFNPVLKYAMESGSVALVDYLMSLMDEMGILSEASSKFTSLASTTNQPTNLLLEAAKYNQIEIVDSILKYQKKLGPLFAVLTASSYPNYVVTGVNQMPVFVQAMANEDPQVFERIFDESLRSIELKADDDFIHAGFKIQALISLLGRINLGIYLQHEHFNPQIFSKILHHKLNVDKYLAELKTKTNIFGAIHSVPFTEVEAGKLDIVFICYRKQLWYGTRNIGNPKVTQEQLKPVNELHHLFYYSQSVKNYAGGVEVLYECFQQGYIDELSKILKKQSNADLAIYANLLLMKAISGQDSSLIDYLTRLKFKVRIDVFKKILELKEPHNQVFIARELFHHLHTNQFEYPNEGLVVVLNHFLVLVNNNNEDQSLKESVNTFLEEINQYQVPTNKHLFFSESKDRTRINQLVQEIEAANSNLNTKV